MIKSEIKNTDRGRILYLTDGHTLIGCSLDFGIRITHLSVCGMDNIFYEQPMDLSDGLFTEDGWKLYGGHRIWNTPEDDTCNSAEDRPVEYKLCEAGVDLLQSMDLKRPIEKELKLRFMEDGRIEVTNIIRNIGDKPMDTAAWGVNTLTGGRAEIDFTESDAVVSGQPGRYVSLWGATNVGDERVKWTKHHLSAQHKDIPDYFKVGLYTKSGKAFYYNKGQKFTLEFGTKDFGSYPDNGCNFEMWMHSKCMELESLGRVTHLLKGESATHIEYWTMEKE